MYYSYFGLTENPFSITPDPRYLFLSRRHEEALAHLVYGLQEGGGFVQLTGEVGTGKTTLIRVLLEQLPANVDVAFLFNPKLTALEFLASICDELHVPYSKDQHSLKTLIDALNSFLLTAHSQGRRVVLIFDEAQNFAGDVLEQIRLLTNLETTKHKLLQIILVGQPELRVLLARTELRQLAQRITARYHLIPMTTVEVKSYIEHRLKIAGAPQTLFSDAAVAVVHKLSGGVPRLVNILCDRALLGAYGAEQSRVTPAMVRHAAEEINGTHEARVVRAPTRSPSASWFATAVLVAAALGVGALWAPLNNLTVNSAVIASAPVGATTATAATTATIDHAATSEPSIPAALPALAANIALPTTTAVPKSATNDKRADDRIVRNNALVEALLTTPGAENLDTAFSSLFGAWRLNYASYVGTTGCERAIGARLHCHWATGSFDQFVAYNYPALIWYESATGEKRYFSVVGVAGEDVVLDVGGKRLLASRDAMREFWPGKYLLLWKPPSLDVNLIRPGAKGEVVVWLRRTLDRLEGSAGSGANVATEFYDPTLVARIQDFQRERKLNPDGLVGELTLLQLAAESGDPSTPLLTHFAASGGE
jgi:general secretion pathway protein A